MKIIIAVDSFKGSCTAREAAEYISRGIRRVYPEAELIPLPIADGGEGTVGAIAAATGGRLISVDVSDPLGRPIRAQYAVLPSGEAVIETAAASGLTLVAANERDALRATTYGTGQLIRHALEHGARRLIIGLGGSATTDGGMGIGRALGIRFLDERGEELGEGGGELMRLARIDADALMPEARESEFILACDVKNPLHGAQGAAYVYAPQKGASPDEAAYLDRALENYGKILKEQLSRDIAMQEGAGAAGGLGCIFMAFMNAAIRPGIELVLDTIDFEEKLRGASLVITGEGRIDAQSAFGKVPCGVARRAKSAAGIPVIAIGGATSRGAEALYDCGVDALFSAVSGICTLDEAMANAAENLQEAAERAMRLIKVGGEIVQKKVADVI